MTFVQEIAQRHVRCCFRGCYAGVSLNCVVFEKISFEKECLFIYNGNYDIVVIKFLS